MSELKRYLVTGSISSQFEYFDVDSIDEEK